MRANTLVWAAVASSASIALAQPSLREIPIPTGPGLPPFNSIEATQLSRDASVVMGVLGQGGSSGVASFRQAGPGPLSILPDDPTYFPFQVHALSADGQAAAGRTFAQPAQGGPILTFATRWAPGQGYTVLPARPGTNVNSDAWGITEHGEMIVGESHGEPVTWTGTTLASLAFPAFRNGGAATSVTPNGNTIAGYITGGGGPAKPVRWDAGVPTELPGIAGETESRALGLSADGQVLVGYSRSLIGGVLAHDRAARWTSAGPELLGSLPGGESSTSLSQAFAASADGSMIVGSAPQSGVGNQAFLWTSTLGMVNLNDYFASRGLDLAGWNLVSANAITPDGAVIAGAGFHNGARVGWVIVVPGPGGLALLGVAGLVARRRVRVYPPA